jgi:hypothetical protein
MKVKIGMRLVIKGVMFFGLVGLMAACSLEGSEEFGCEDEPNPVLFENPPQDTVFIKVESEEVEFNRTFSGIRLDEPEDYPIEGEYENLSIYERDPKPDNGRLFGLGTRVSDSTDDAGIVVSFNLLTGSQIAEVCRSGKVFQTEHDWSRWDTNVVGVEIFMTIPIDGKMVTFTSDTNQNDADLFYIDGAEYLDGFGFYAKLSGNFSVTMQEIDHSTATPREIHVSGSYILDMKVSR